MNKENQSPLQQLDYTLLFIIFLLLCVSLISIDIAPKPDYVGNLAIQQVVWYGIGAVAITAVMWVDFDRFRHIAWVLYGLGILLLFPLLLARLHILPSCAHGCTIVTSNGATSWYYLPGMGQLQPSEFMKIFLIIALSHVIVSHHERHPEKTNSDDLILLAKIVGWSLIPLGLVAIQPDLGTAMILTAIMLSLLLVSGIRWRILLITTLIGILFIGINILLFIYFPDHALLKPYQMTRIYAWLDPEHHASNGDAYQLLQSLKAIGSGQLYGTFPTHNGVDVPAAWTDFIFAVIAEKFGFLGASAVISLFFMLIYRIIHTALGTHDRFGSFICAGVIGMLTFQVFQNIGMTVQVLPITGIPLPFISYGGSALLSSMMAVGLVLNVRSRKRTYMFETNH